MKLFSSYVNQLSLPIADSKVTLPENVEATAYSEDSNVVEQKGKDDGFEPLIVQPPNSHVADEHTRETEEQRGLGP